MPLNARKKQAINDPILLKVFNGYPSQGDLAMNECKWFFGMRFTHILCESLTDYVWATNWS